MAHRITYNFQNVLPAIGDNLADRDVRELDATRRKVSADLVGPEGPRA